jgi:hypothetical protein
MSAIAIVVVAALATAAVGLAAYAWGWLSGNSSCDASLEVRDDLIRAYRDEVAAKDDLIYWLDKKCALNDRIIENLDAQTTHYEARINEQRELIASLAEYVREV